MVNFNQTTMRFNCTFFAQVPNRFKQCKANITHGNNCDQQIGSFNGNGSGDTVVTEIIELQPIEGVNAYCFSVIASSGNKTVIVEGTLDVISFGKNYTACFNYCNDTLFSSIMLTRLKW